MHSFCHSVLVSHADVSILHLQTAVGMSASQAYRFPAMKDVCVGVADHLSSMMLGSQMHWTAPCHMHTTTRLLVTSKGISCILYLKPLQQQPCASGCPLPLSALSPGTSGN